MPLPIPVPWLLVERLQWEMAEWEIHALRNLATVLIIQVQVYARTHPEAEPLAETLVGFKRQMEAAQLQAMMDPVKRRTRT